MSDHTHLEIHLLFCIFDLSTNLYTITRYSYCNDCGAKIHEPVLYNQMDRIPNGLDGVIRKVICNVRSNGYEYAWFGHDEDRRFFVEHGDKWQ